MFAKLLKYEIKSTAGLLGLMSLIALGVGILGGFLLRTAMNTSAATDTYEIISIVSAVATPFILLSLLAYAFGGEIYLAVQFYRRKFTDQGYLTFTLPTRSWQIYLSSLINIILWTLVISTVTVVAFGCTFIIGIYDSDVWHRMTEIGVDFSLALDSVLPEFSGWSLVDPIVRFVSGNVLLLTSITLGCVVAKKHKVLGSIGCYYLISIVISNVSTVFGTSFVFDSVETQLNQMYMSSFLLNIAVILAGSFLSVWLMDKKLNLP